MSLQKQRLISTEQNRSSQDGNWIESLEMKHYCIRKVQIQVRELRHHSRETLWFQNPEKRVCLASCRISLACGFQAKCSNLVSQPFTGESFLLNSSGFHATTRRQQWQNQSIDQRTMLQVVMGTSFQPSCTERQLACEFLIAMLVWPAGLAFPTKSKQWMKCAPSATMTIAIHPKRQCLPKPNKH